MIEADLDALIIGAGPAGTTAAAYLQREGFRLQVVERETFPRFVIGESLLPSSLGILEDVGLLEAVRAQGFMEKCGAVFLRGSEICNFDFSEQFSDGWKHTYQVPRADFDKTLAAAVADRGVEICYGETVTAAKFEDSGATITVQTSAGIQRVVTTKFVLDCSGYGRVLPRLLDLERPSPFPPREAIFAHVTGDHRPKGREEGKIWVCMHPGNAWIWIIPFSNGKTSIGVVAAPDFFKRYAGEPESRFRAIIREDSNAAARLAEMKLVFPPRRITGYACAIKQLFGRRFALVGNATEFLDPIFSSGVSLALESARRAARVLARELRGDSVDWQTEYADFVMQGINTFRAYVSAWYDQTLPEIFFAARANPEVMRQICSVLAGYVWDQANPYVVQPTRALPLLAQIIRARARSQAEPVR